MIVHQRVATVDHFQITRRYAEFSGGLLSVMDVQGGGAAAEADEKTRRMLADLQQEVRIETMHLFCANILSRSRCRSSTSS